MEGLSKVAEQEGLLWPAPGWQSSCDFSGEVSGEPLRTAGGGMLEGLRVPLWTQAGASG